MSRAASPHVRNPGCFHGRWGGPEVLEDGCFTGLVRDLVALEYNSSFHFPSNIATRQFAVLFDTYAEGPSEMSFNSFTHGLLGDVVPFSYLGFISDLLVAQRFPLFTMATRAQVSDL